MKTTDFKQDIAKGKIGEQIFVEDFLNFLDIKYIDVTGSQAFQILDTDFRAHIGTYEIKTNYRDNKVLIFEDYTNFNEKLGPIKKGWVYKSKANLIVFVSKDTRTMIFLPFTDKFKQYYVNQIVPSTKQIFNRISIRGNSKWQSTFRRVDFDLLDGWISAYKIKHSNPEENTQKAIETCRIISKQLQLSF